MPCTVLHLGGNGHASTRLAGARRASPGNARAWSWLNVPYPGFERRPRAGSLEAFLESLSRSCRDLPGPPACGYASGIGALLALGLRARGDLVGVPLIFQGPVLWGLEHRWFPRAIAPVPAGPGLLRLAFRSPRFQARFARKQFERPHEPDTLGPFFEGYELCTAFGDFFDWLTPGWLRTLERSFLERPEAVGGPGLDRWPRPRRRARRGSGRPSGP